MTTVDAPASAEQTEWEARAQADIGVLIHSYLLTHPAPCRSVVADALDDSAAMLMDAGLRWLNHLGQPRLRLTGGSA
jgi:hypothetical protein